MTRSNRGRDPARGRTGGDVLFVESNDEYAAAFADSLADGAVPVTTHVVADDEEALEFVHRRGDHAEAPRPSLVVVDLDLPGGARVLSELKRHAELCQIPVIAVASSADDAARSYDLRANATVAKPTDPAAFADVARSIDDFWLESVRLPRID